MSKGNLVSMQIPAAVVQQAVQLLSDLDTLLKPYYSKVASDEKNKLHIVSEERLPFVTKGMQYVGTDPDYLPKKSSISELNNDNDLFNTSRQIFTPLQQIRGGILNTNNLAGSDVFITLLDYYNTAQREAQKGDARAKVIYDDLKKLFIKKSKNGAPAPAPAQ